ncbi:MAG: broad specificity phosphatase PhoE [Desulforhopalus sp.]|jgi:broad specificity phosphatase PhoE
MKTINPSGIRIILVRHGETEWNRLHRFQGRSDIPLNQKGEEQARALGVALKNETITALYSSPLKRAITTGQHIGKFHPSRTLIKESGLVEMDLGDFEGMEAHKWATEYQEFRAAWEKNPASLSMPGGESLEEVQHRAVVTLDRISKFHAPGSTLVICSHNFVIVSLLCFALQRPLNQFRELRQDTAALNILYKDGALFQIEKINDCNHLQE